MKPLGHKVLRSVALAASMALAGCTWLHPKEMPAVTHVPIAAPLARPIAPRGLTLVLSGGSARGFAHIGVIKVLEQAGIRPDLVVGTSAGGILAHGFARARCADCGHDFLIAYSCKCRGVCPSCTTRRMVETAAPLADHVIPRLPVRQWVLSVPKRLRYPLERDPAVLNAALHIFLTAIEQVLRQHSPAASAASRLGAVIFIHRFGALLNTHLHFHCIVIDGGFEADAQHGVTFHAASAVDAPAIAAVQATVRKRLLRSVEQRGLLSADGAQTMADWEHGGGFSVDAAVRIEAHERDGLERLLRYCARPALEMQLVHVPAGSEVGGDIDLRQPRPCRTLLIERSVERILLAVHDFELLLELVGVRAAPGTHVEIYDERGPVRHEVGGDTAVKTRVAIEVAGGIVRKNRLQVRRLLFGREKLRAPHVGYAAHADVAVAPRLLADPFDDVVQVLLLLGAEQIVDALGIIAAAHVGDDMRITARHPEFGDAGFVLAQRDYAPLQLTRVDGSRHQRRKLHACGMRPDNISRQAHTVAHRNARFVVGDARVARLGALGRAWWCVKRVLRRDQRIDAANAVGVYFHGGDFCVVSIQF